MKHWILSLEPNIENFQSILSGNNFEYIYDAGLFLLPYTELTIGDEILGYTKAPSSMMNYKLKVEGVEVGKLHLRKEFEFAGISKSEVINVVPRLITPLMENTEELLIELDETEFNKIWQVILSNITSPNSISITTNPSSDIPHPLNRIIFGAPGTGKSFMIEEQRETYFLDRYRRVTFYPNYSYGQFFGTYKPIKEKAIPTAVDSKITYDFVPGPFFRTLLDSIESMQIGTAENYLLIVEEINRANAPAVFGDVFQLLDRDAQGVSEYPITLSEDAANYLLENHPTIQITNNEIKIPSNMYIWATMNSADQGVQPLDSAFKRRFDFEYISINDGENEIQGIEVTIPGLPQKIDWNNFRRTLNEFLVREYTHLKEDKLIGPFFIKKSVLQNEKDFGSTFINKLLMYLFEDVLKTANKEKLFSKRTFSELVEVSKNSNLTERKVFTDLFYTMLVGKFSAVTTEGDFDEVIQSEPTSDTEEVVVSDGAEVTVEE